MVRILKNLHPEIPFARSSRASASSVSLFPRPRIRDITSDRFAFVKTSGMPIHHKSHLSILIIGGAMQPNPCTANDSSSPEFVESNYPVHLLCLVDTTRTRNLAARHADVQDCEVRVRRTTQSDSLHIRRCTLQSQTNHRDCSPNESNQPCAAMILPALANPR